MIKVGLTGGIGSGKSAIAAVFQLLKIPVFDADYQAKFIMENDEDLKLALKQLFGEEAFKDNKLNRPHIANIVFNNSNKLELLNKLVHPATINAATNWMAAQKTPYLIKEAALLFESGSVAGLDYVIGVHAPLHLRIQRVMQRDQVKREQVLTRISRQIDEKIKMKLCDFVVVNDEQTLVIPQVLALHDRFTLLAKSKI